MQFLFGQHACDEVAEARPAYTNAAAVLCRISKAASAMEIVSAGWESLDGDRMLGERWQLDAV